MAVHTSIVVSFGSTDDSTHLTAVLDDEKNNSMTSFSAGDAIYFRVYHSGTYTVATTSGSVSKVEHNTAETGLEELIGFVFSPTTNASKRIVNINSFTWFGTSLGTVSKLGESDCTGVKAANASDDTIGIGVLTYSSAYDLWKLQAPTTMPSTYAIVIGITAT